ncbi:aldehyde dehydrogenase family protein [Paraburkholderia sp. BL27I4N3]|uniref:aldehyde dehydrogenase family protein n=1 Tax=Paraburkholderia sp. BL27I4N3 TaxID=1938805 RepID=UPI0038573AD5
MVHLPVFSDVTNDMMIAREEIFGALLSIITYRDADDAITIASDMNCGLQAYAFSADEKRAREAAPFGGFKQSGIGREYGTFWAGGRFLSRRPFLLHFDCATLAFDRTSRRRTIRGDLCCGASGLKRGRQTKDSTLARVQGQPMRIAGHSLGEGVAHAPTGAITPPSHSGVAVPFMQHVSRWRFLTDSRSRL